MPARSPLRNQPRYQVDNDAIESGVVLQELRAQFSSPSYTPPLLPAVALEVHALAKRPNLALKDLIETIERDATLAASTLRRAQSASFSTRIPPRTLEDAVRRLGTDGVRDLVWEVALSGRVFRGSPPINGFMEDLRKHSLAVAHLSRLVASHTSLEEDSAFLAGLLHDVGLACALLLLGEDRNRTFDMELMSGVLQDVHADAGDTVARIWQLPDDLRWSIAAHHRGQLDGMPNPLACVVVLAECLANELNYGFSAGQTPADETGPAAMHIACNTVGIARPDLPKLAERAAPMLDAVLSGL